MVNFSYPYNDLVICKDSNPYNDLVICKDSTDYLGIMKLYIDKP